jgi:anti-sigma factor RsiW
MQAASEHHPRELLPWLANGTLEGAERTEVERHVADCAQCQSELALLKTLRNTLQAQPQTDAGELGLQRLLRSVRKEPGARPRWLLPAAMAAGLVIAVQTVMLMQTGPVETVYAPLSGPATGEVVLQVEFTPDAREVELRAALHAVGARIVDGPSAAGVYRIALEPGRDSQQALDELQARTDLVRHIAREP